MPEALARYFALASGLEERVTLTGREPLVLRAGGGAHVVAFVGHDGLMDVAAPDITPPAATTPARGAIALACFSRSYFGPLLVRTGAELLVTTNGLMAPEAYVLDAALRRWFEGGSADDARSAAAAAYDRFQRCGARGARRLFGG